MSVDTPDRPIGSIFRRVKALLLRPRDEWPVIARDPSSSGDTFTRYAIPLAAIGPVAGFLGSQVFGYGTWGIRFRPSFFGSLSQAIGEYVLSLVALLAISFIADKLATKFGGESSTRNAFKLLAYSMTASWLAGIFGLFPSLGFLVIAGFYSIYLFYTGAQPLMKIPAEKVGSYTAATVVCGFVVMFLAFRIAAGVGGLFGATSFAGGSITTSDGAKIELPDGDAIDTARIERAAKDIEAAVTTRGNTVAPNALQALLPDHIGAYKRTAQESSQGGPASQAEATYESGSKEFTLKVSDIAVVGALANIGAAFGVQSNKEDEDGYERTSTKNGNLVVERWDNSSEDGRYMTMIGKRFIVEAEGEATSIEELRAAVGMIDPARLIALGNKGG